MINLGIIGLGGITRNRHIPAIKQNGRFHFSAAADIFPDNGTAEAFGIDRYYDDYKAMLADPSIDAVLISSPHDLHVEHCEAAFNAGKHVLLEKPIARDLHEAQAIMNAAEKAGTVLMIGHLQRFNPVNYTIKQLIDNGELGHCLSARVDHYQNFNPPATSWWRDKTKSGGGSVIGSGVHRLDLLRWFLGEPVSVYARSVDMPERLEAEACAHAIISFENGAIAEFSINWCVYQYIYAEALSLTGTNGTICTSASKVCANQDALKMSKKDVDGGAMKDVIPYTCKTMYDHFADCVENGEKPLTSGLEGYKTLQLIRAIYRSIETGKIISPADITY